MRSSRTAVAVVALGLGVMCAPVAHGATTITVAKDGSGDYSTVQAAVDAATAGSTIRIKPGAYAETVTVPTSKRGLTIQGTTGKPGDAVIAAGHASWMAKPGGGTYGTAGSATVTIAANDVTVENITIANTYDPSAHPQGYAQAVALNADGDRQVYRGDRFTGLQDTLLAWEPTATSRYRQLFEGSHIDGNVDFVFGDSTAVFYQDAITLVDRGAAAGSSNGYVAAPATDRSVTYGFLIDACTVTSTAARDTFYLGRPWHPGSSTAADPQIVIRDTALPAQIKASGWTTMSGYAFSPGRYAEYRNVGAGAATNLSRPQLTDSQASAYTPQRYLAGSDGWRPLG
jgi:pectate lyase